MKKRKVNRVNLSIVFLLPIFFGIIMGAIWALGLGLSALCHFHHGIFLNWLVGLGGIIALFLIYLFLRWLSEVICAGIGTLIDFIYAEEEK